MAGRQAGGLRGRSPWWADLFKPDQSVETCGLRCPARHTDQSATSRGVACCSRNDMTSATGQHVTAETHRPRFLARCRPTNQRRAETRLLALGVGGCVVRVWRFLTNCSKPLNFKTDESPLLQPRPPPNHIAGWVAYLAVIACSVNIQR